MLSPMITPNACCQENNLLLLLQFWAGTVLHFCSPFFDGGRGTQNATSNQRGMDGRTDRQATCRVSFITTTITTTTYLNTAVDVSGEEQILAPSTHDDILQSGFEYRQRGRIPGGYSRRIHVHRMHDHSGTFKSDHAGRRSSHVSGADAANALDRF